MLVTKQLMDPIDFHSIFSILFKISSFVFSRRKKNHTGLEQLEGE